MHSVWPLKCACSNVIYKLYRNCSLQSPFPERCGSSLHPVLNGLHFRDLTRSGIAHWAADAHWVLTLIGLGCLVQNVVVHWNSKLMRVLKDYIPELFSSLRPEEFLCFKESECVLLSSVCWEWLLLSKCLFSLKLIKRMIIGTWTDCKLFN